MKDFTNDKVVLPSLEIIEEQLKLYGIYIFDFWNKNQIVIMRTNGSYHNIGDLAHWTIMNDVVTDREVDGELLYLTMNMEYFPESMIIPAITNFIYRCKSDQPSQATGQGYTLEAIIEYNNSLQQTTTDDLIAALQKFPSGTIVVGDDGPIISIQEAHTQDENGSKLCNISIHSWSLEDGKFPIIGRVTKS